MHGRTLAVALLTLGVAGCGPEVAQRAAEIELEIGGAAEGSEHFVEISGLTQDGSGRIWVTDAQGNDVRVFTPDGSLAFQFGGFGTGPSQFTLPCCLSFDGQGRLWVRDGGNARYSVFQPGDTGVTPLFTVPLPRTEQPLRYPIRFDSEGQVIDVRLSLSGSGGGARLYRLDTLGVAQDTVVLPPWPPDSLGVVALQGDGAIWFVSPPYGPEDLIAYGPAGVYARAISRRYKVDMYASGTLIRSIVREETRSPLLTREQQDTAERQIGSDARRIGFEPIELSALMPFRNQLLGALLFDETGRLWVERRVGPDAELRIADVWGADGALLYEATWPLDIRLAPSAFITEETALAVRMDTVPGNERIVRLRWR
jgi:hypothetical protein